eukprot:TRINITY_DN3729_c0_g2_i1.p1 TRINITY_DN3729_c0_g2~~TRINITY_DN3729_c0_g2_i1.p1  ORF type:complete len:375 (+),score=86.58 TRINITY_DN3729_c0_g2_i1:112-1125(+)
MSGPQCAICMSALADGQVLDPCEHAICKPCFATWAKTCRCAIPGVPPECVHCSTGFVECPFCRELTTHPAEAHNDQRKRKMERDQRHALRRARERAQAEQRAGGYTSKSFKITKNREGTIGVRFRGMEITDVLSNTPAHTAGLQIGMRIMKIEGLPVQDHSDAVHDALKAAPNTFTITVDAPRLTAEAARERAGTRNHARDADRERERERERERLLERERERQRAKEKEKEKERLRAVQLNRNQDHLMELRLKVEREREKEKERMRAMGLHQQLHDYRQNHRGMWHPVNHAALRGPQHYDHMHHQHAGRMPYAGLHHNPCGHRAPMPQHPARPLHMP